MGNQTVKDNRSVSEVGGKALWIAYSLFHVPLIMSIYCWSIVIVGFMLAAIAGIILGGLIKLCMWLPRFPVNINLIIVAIVCAVTGMHFLTLEASFFQLAVTGQHGINLGIGFNGWDVSLPGFVDAYGKDLRALSFFLIPGLIAAYFVHARLTIDAAEPEASHGRQVVAQVVLVSYAILTIALIGNGALYAAFSR